MVKQEKPSSSVEDLIKSIYVDAEAFAHRKNVSKRERPDDNDYGFAMTNPVCTLDEDGEKAYLTRLQTIDGKNVEWSKVGSYSVQSEDDLKPVKINKYQLYLEGKPLTVLFLCPFGFFKEKAPNGFTLLARDFEAEMEECNAAKVSDDKTENHLLSVSYRNYDDNEGQLLQSINSRVSFKNENVQKKKLTKGKRTTAFILVFVAVLTLGSALFLWGRIMNEREEKPIQTEMRKQIEKEELKYTSVTLTEIYNQIKKDPMAITGEIVQIEGYAYVIAPGIIVVTQSSKFDDFGNGSYSKGSNGYQELKNRITGESDHYFEINYLKDSILVKSGDYVYAKGELEFTRNAVDTGYVVCVYATTVIVEE